MSDRKRLCTCCKKNWVPADIEVCATCAKNAQIQFSAGMGLGPTDEVFIDEVGGQHSEGIGWNPNGIWCGECVKSTCKGCKNEHATKEGYA